MIRRPAECTLFPDTTLFRSLEAGADDAAGAGRDGEAPLVEAVHRDLEALPLVPDEVFGGHLDVLQEELARDRKSTRLNSSHANISYAVFCLKKKMPHLAVHA